MLLGARLALFGGSQNPPPSANPYVTDGLIFQLDGIWNGGIGVHDEKMNSCVDLCESGIVAPCTNHENYLTFAANMVSSSAVDGWIESWFGSRTKHAFHTEAVVYCPNILSSTFSLTLGLPIVYGSSSNTTPSVSFNNAGKVRINPKGGVGNPNTYTFETPLYTSGVNNFSVGSVAGGGEAGEFSRFVNGSLLLNGSVSPSTNTPYVNTASQYYPPFLKTNANSGIDARVYSFRVYSRELTEDEVAANYVVDKERFNLS